MKTKQIPLIGIILVFFTSSLVCGDLAIVYSDNDYGCGWENYADYVTVTNSYETGINVAAYAANGSGVVRIMQIRHNGDWLPDPNSIQNFVNRINSTTSIHAYFLGYADLGATNLSQVDMLYITGHNWFSFSDGERAALKSYLDSGGLLFADDCSNIQDYQGFETSFRTEVYKMYQANLKVITGDHDLYAMYYALDGFNFSYSLPGNGTVWNNEPLEGFFINWTVAAEMDFDPDTLNLSSKGKYVTVYLELPQGHDVNDIGISTLMLNGTVPAQSRPWAIGDYDNDGVPDLMVKFDRQAIHLEVNDNVSVWVQGELSTGFHLAGDDVIRVIDKGN